MPEQLAFHLPMRESRTRGDFFVSDANAFALARLDAPAGWPNRKLVLFGPEGAGKTHLAHVWAERTNALFLTPGKVVAERVPLIQQPVVLDDAMPMQRPEQEAVFHLHNHLAAASLPFLLVAQEPPARWNLKLADLQSRMAATDTAKIEAPDDALLSAVIVKQFADRQLIVPPNLVAWLVARMDRSFAAARHMVEALDHAALAEGRAVSRSLAQNVLKELPSR
ncbi:MAG: chromosomal replication initiator DnaA [Pseudomonadota bacterium]